MATWTQQDDTHIATVNGYTVKITPSEQFSSYSFVLVKDGRMVKAGDSPTLREGKDEAEREALERG